MWAPCCWYVDHVLTKDCIVRVKCTHAITLLCVQALVPLLAEPDDALVSEAWAAVNAVALTIPKETQPAFVRVLKVCKAFVRTPWQPCASPTRPHNTPNSQASSSPALCSQDAVDTAGDKQRRRRAAYPETSPYVPGLCLPKALAPLLPIYLQGILQVQHAHDVS